MKKLILLPFIGLLSVNLNARMNPFEPTDTFVEQQKVYEMKLKQEEQKKIELEQQRKLAILAQQEAQEKADELHLQQEREIQLEKQKKLQKKKEAVTLPPKDSYEILPFINIKVSDNQLEIFIDKRYKLINQDILEDQKKFLFDFGATESFYTIRKNLKSKNFKSFAVGTHLEQNFFRVVVELNDIVSKYKEDINSNTSYIKINKIK